MYFKLKKKIIVAGDTHAHWNHLNDLIKKESPMAKPRFIMDIKYESITKALKKLKITKWDIDKKLKDSNNKDYLYL